MAGHERTHRLQPDQHHAGVPHRAAHRGGFDKLGKYAGAGSFVPITGFANAMVSPALEFRREGLVLGLGAKLFSIAGPVLVYGIGASVLVGVVYALFFR